MVLVFTDVDSYVRHSATFVTFRLKKKRERRPMAQLRTHLPLKRASTCSAPVHRSPLHPKRLLAAGTTSSPSRQRAPAPTTNNPFASSMAVPQGGTSRSVWWCCSWSQLMGNSRSVHFLYLSYGYYFIIHMNPV